MSNLDFWGNLPPLPPRPLVWLPDRWNWWQFRCEVYDLDERPICANAVYNFATASNQIIYTGKTRNTGDRLFDHDRLPMARLYGATRLLIHQPMPDARWTYDQVEAILIHSYRPPLNQQSPALPWDYILGVPLPA